MTRKDYILIAEALKMSFTDAHRHDSQNGMTGKAGNTAAGVLFTSGRIAEALTADNARFDRYHFLAVVRGEKALTSRPGSKPAKKITKVFRVAAISDNTNSFGLHNVVLVARSGEAWQVKSSGFDLPKKGFTFMTTQIVEDLIARGWELPEQISNAPAGVISEVWS